MKLSVVSTLYKSAPFIQEFHSRVSRVASQFAGSDYEILLVNDGCPENSLEVALKIARQDNRVVVVDLSRNFGHHRAMMAGLGEAKGDLIFLIDSDLEEEPEQLINFSKVMEDEACDVVYGVQNSRKGGWFERWSGALFYSLFDRLTYIEHPRNLITMRLMTRRYVDALLRFGEQEMVISCLWVIVGFKQCALIVTKHKRSGTSYSLAAKFRHVVNAVTSFSAAPLVLIFYSGFAIFCVALIYSIYIAYQRIVSYQPVDGWTSLIVSVWLLGGLIILFLGVIGIYLSKVYIETKRRPLTIIRKIYGRS
jgi:putative glycosyltransferase